MGKTIVITGTSSGIGRATALKFAGKGWNVIATMRDPTKGEALAALENVIVTPLDVRDPESIRAVVAAANVTFGRIDVLVNNAGYGQFGVFEGIPRAKMLEQFEVNVFGPMDLIRAVLPAMRASGSGVIINVSSGAGIFTLPMISLYCASKFALEGFSEALAYELLALGIVVKLVEPHGGVGETNFNDAAAEHDAHDRAPDDYEPFVECCTRTFGKLLSARAITASDVAETIYDAATDGTDRLRYLVGNDTRGFIRARAELPDEKYVAFMREHFREALRR